MNGSAESYLVFEEQAPHEKGFAAHFDRHIRPKLEDMEGRRLEAIDGTRGRTPWAILAGFAILSAAFWIAQWAAGD